MRKITYITNLLLILSLVVALGGCRKRGLKSPDNADTPFMYEPEVEIKGDSMLYGLSCDGSSDSVIVLWPFKGDPISYNCIDAKRQGRIIGKPQIGDWVGVMVNPEDTTEATFVINLDQLKGTWTYPVFPVMKELEKMSKRMQHRMMENLNDSIKQTYFIPREYGFTLKRSHNAQAVGRIMRSNSLEDDSPVQYPEVRNYRKWYMHNGRLLLVSYDPIIPGQEKGKRPEVLMDTLDFVYMDNDSLILRQHGIRYGFHRKENALKANAAATKAQQEQDAKK